MHVWSGVRSFSPRPHEGRVFRRERQRERFDKRLTGMHDVITDFLLADKSRTAFWEEWRYQVSHARQQVERRKVTFYCLRFFATVSTILVASLVGLNLSGRSGLPFAG